MVDAHHVTGINNVTTDVLPRRDTPRRSIDPPSVALTLFIFSIGNETAVDEVDGRWRDPARIDDAVARGELILHQGLYPSRPPSPHSYMAPPGWRKSRKEAVSGFGKQTSGGRSPSEPKGAGAVRSSVDTVVPLEMNNT